MKNKVKFLKDKYFWILLFIIAGSFLRLYNFVPWLHFELDQSRDAILISEAIRNGAGELPLLGPRAAGSFLRLGPASYYIEFLFAKIFTNTPVAIAYAVSFFSILSLPMFYLFNRRYFSKKVSLVMLATFSFSLFFIVYSRFSWNPNLLPFFILLFLYALLRTADKEEKRNGYWLIISAFSYGLLSQFHFLALIIMALVGLVFLLVKRPTIKLKFWLLSIATVFFLYTPVFINEIKTGGKNYQQFLETVSDKSEKKKYPLAEKFIKNYTENSLKYWTITTGSQTAELPKFKLVDDYFKFDVQCDRYCRDNLPLGIMAVIFFTSGIILLFFKTISVKNILKKDFLILNLILLLISFLIFTPLSFDLSPRFWLIVTPLPFIFWGLIIASAEKFLRNKNIFWIAGMLLVASNLLLTFRYFNELKNAKIKDISIATDKIMKQKTRVTLEQQLAIVEYIETFYNENKYPIFYRSQNEYHRAFAYFFDRREILRDGLSVDKICRQGNYFLIIRSQSTLDKFQKYLAKFDILVAKKFGTLTVFHLQPKKEFITCEKANSAKFRDDNSSNNKTAKRYKWKEILK